MPVSNNIFSRPIDIRRDIAGHFGLAGLIAQDMESILSFSVTERDSYKYLEYNVLHAYEIAGIQSHEERIKDLECKVEKLEQENAELKARLNA